AQDATAVAGGSEFAVEDGTPRWKTFGRAQTGVTEDAEPTARFGWGIASPLLLLSAGTRTVTLTLGFSDRKTDWVKLKALLKQEDRPFEIVFSGAKNWLFPSATTLNCDVDEKTLTLTMTVPDTLPAVVAPGGYADIDSLWPVLAVRLRHIFQETDAVAKTGRHVTVYQAFRNLTLARVELQVEVTGFTGFRIANDGSELDPNSPFEPFGPSPSVGSRFYFGHPELLSKRLDSVSFNTDWMALPASFPAHYANYGVPAITEKASFKAIVGLADRRSGRTLAQAPAKSFFLAGMQAAFVDYPVDRHAVVDGQVKNMDRHLFWELTAPDFQHAAYPGLAASKAVALATAIANKKDGSPDINADLFQIKPPYTPKIKTLTLNYVASTVMAFAPAGTEKHEERLFHIHPFGYAEIDSKSLEPIEFLPNFDNEGELYLGIENLKPPQNLSLLLQMAEGSADPDLAPVPVEWSCLSGNRWLPLTDGQVLGDATRGLINSGIVEFSLKPVQPSTLLPRGLYWLRASIARHADSVCDTVAVHTQAVSAVSATGANAAEFSGRPLPAGSITRLSNPVPEIKALRQPYSSFGGKPAERDDLFHTRISERLRHKQRALTVWDYEHLILEHFPDIYKTKCLPASATSDVDDAGRVNVVVVPDIRRRRPFDPFQPKVPADRIKDIEAFIKAIAPPWADIRVVNPFYIPVTLRFGVRFLKGYDESYYARRLNDDLNRFLAPWAYDQDADIAIGGRIYANSLIDYIDKRPYVDYVTDLKLFSGEGGAVSSSASEGQWVGADTRPDGILMSSGQHQIDPIPDTGYHQESFVGINYMKIELDFIVA
ncbi:MAG: baseplate J/gp47 family protein, partial [Gammaproteobacteria bacterium]